MKSSRFWAWLTFGVGAAYFFIPLIATFEFSMRMRRGEYSFDAYRVVFGDERFQATFTYSVVVAVFTILLGVLLVVPTAYWIRLRMPQIRPVVEFITLLPLVIPVLWPSFLGTVILLFANAFGAIATAYAFTGSSLNIVPIKLYAQIRGDVLFNPNLGYALAFGMIVITGMANMFYIWFRTRSERWLK